MGCGGSKMNSKDMNVVNVMEDIQAISELKHKIFSTYAFRVTCLIEQQVKKDYIDPQTNQRVPKGSFRKGTGFPVLFSLGLGVCIKCLVTTSQLIPKDYLTPSDTFTISTFDPKGIAKTTKIKINDRFTYNEPYSDIKDQNGGSNFTVIELKQEDEFGKDFFLTIGEKYDFKLKDNENDNRNDFIMYHIPEGKTLATSTGVIIGEENDSTFYHSAFTTQLSQGAPIIWLAEDDPKVIGMHKDLFIFEPDKESNTSFNLKEKINTKINYINNGSNEALKIKRATSIKYILKAITQPAIDYINIKKKDYIIINNDNVLSTNSNTTLKNPKKTFRSQDLTYINNFAKNSTFIQKSNSSDLYSKGSNIEFSNYQYHISVTYNSLKQNEDVQILGENFVVIGTKLQTKSFLEANFANIELFHNNKNLQKKNKLNFDKIGDSTIEIAFYQFLPSCREMFYNCSKITNIDFESIDTSQADSMKSMFEQCHKLTSISNINNLCTINVRNMSYMFKSCNKLIELNLSNFNTESVTAMTSMFESCNSLIKLDVSNWKNTNVTDMSWMFYDCSKLSEVNLAQFLTDNVEDMTSMFNNCNKLQFFDVGSFNTKKCKNMSGMFGMCSKLLYIDVSGFDTSQCVNMSSMFEGCSSMTELDLLNFNTEACTNMGKMFFGCSKLTVLDINFKVKNVKNMSKMFHSCAKLEELNLTSFEMCIPDERSGIFTGCNKLGKIKVFKGNSLLKQLVQSYGIKCDS